MYADDGKIDDATFISEVMPGNFSVPSYGGKANR
ncbi:MAG: hypothetical protein JWN70_7064, partial [Planctomycetaceae bacterium]|nr:hypothetical protein [Planctomycetaceae bacterium]